jgi:M6 family metalloprotease-like protein
MPTPFQNEEFTFTNPDGSTIQVRGWGNQYYAVFETVDGYTVVQDPETGFYKYAQLSDDKNELLPTDAKVGEVDPQSLGLQKHIRIRRESANQKAMTASLQSEGKSRWQIRREQKKIQLKGITPTTESDAAPPSRKTVGNYVGLCVLIQFPDVSGTISQQEVTDFCNLHGYSGFGNNGSVRDYYYDISRGKLTYTNIVTQYYTAKHNRSYYTDESIAWGVRARELLLEALDNLTSNGFNFGQLSTDTGGYVYAVNMFYAGSRGKNWGKGLWPGSGSLTSPYDIGGGKKIFDFQFTNMGQELTLRTFCHENGHMICDFPDLYDYTFQTTGAMGVGNYCLMAYGGNDLNPVEVCAYLKNEAGWATKTVSITPGITASLSAENNDFYTYSKSATEYFIIENRQKKKRDIFLPDEGLAIWHIDELCFHDYHQMTPDQHYECSLEQADGRFDMEKSWYNTGDSEDLFSSPYNTEFSENTHPNTTWWDGSKSSLKITKISAPGATMSFEVPSLINPKFIKDISDKRIKDIRDIKWKDILDTRVQYKNKDVKEIQETHKVQDVLSTAMPSTSLEGRVEQLEQAFTALTHFIGSEQRPDLETSALNQESDLLAISQELQKQANDAKLAKDNKDVEKLREV